MRKTNAAARCRDCMHYYITHDAAFRYGCRALDFKSRRLPEREVIDASGQPCQYYSRRDSRLTMV